MNTMDLFAKQSHQRAIASLNNSVGRGTGVHSRLKQRKLRKGGRQMGRVGILQLGWARSAALPGRGYLPASRGLLLLLLLLLLFYFFLFF
jgi:hypothetical protein